ncbi:hypothetical protein ACJA23_00490 [Mycoplasma corogypsi]|uniref:hypothetical protein n=1 Tax=Mycoplasma corogypsi TaxID=2106 RepID=UPI0038732282
MPFGYTSFGKNSRELTPVIVDRNGAIDLISIELSKTYSNPDVVWRFNGQEPKRLGNDDFDQVKVFNFPEKLKPGLNEFKLVGTYKGRSKEWVLKVYNNNKTTSKYQDHDYILTKVYTNVYESNKESTLVNIVWDRKQSKRIYFDLENRFGKKIKNVKYLITQGPDWPVRRTFFTLDKINKNNHWNELSYDADKKRLICRRRKNGYAYWYKWII